MIDMIYMFGNSYDLCLYSFFFIYMIYELYGFRSILFMM